MKRLRLISYLATGAFLAACSGDKSDRSSAETADSTVVKNVAPATPATDKRRNPPPHTGPVAITKPNLNVYDNSELSSPSFDVPQRSVATRAPAPGEITWVFECGDYPIIALFETRDVLVDTPDGGFRLFPEQVAEGRKYANDHATLWVDGETAAFELDGKRYENCKHDAKRSIWEDARLRGVSFRGTGNEPGWLLEIDIKSIVFETNYGADRFVFPGAIPELDTETMAATYDVVHHGHAIKVMLRNEGCADSMSDDHFATSVEIVLDGTTYRGCGRVLE